MNFRKLFLVCIIFSCLFFSGCDQIMGLINPEEEETTDVSIQSIVPLTNSYGLTGVRVIFENNGTTDVNNVLYSIAFSTDNVVSMTNDTVLYESYISIEAGKIKQVDIDAEDDIMPWMMSHSLEMMATDDYYVGCCIDPHDTLSEDNELNNEGVSPQSFHIEGDGDTSSLSIAISGANYDFYGKKFMFGIYYDGESPEYMNPQATGEAYIYSDYLEVTPVEYDDYYGDDWEPEMYTEYDIYLMIDMNGDGEYTPYEDWSYYDNSDNNDCYDLYVNDYYEEVTVNITDFQVESFTELKVSLLDDGSFFYGERFIIGVFRDGESLDTADPLAVGEVTVDSTNIEVKARDYYTEEYWNPEMYENYDVYFIIDVDNNYEYTPYVDWAYYDNYENKSHYDLYFDSEEIDVTVSASEFHRESSPSLIVSLTGGESQYYSKSFMYKVYYSDTLIEYYDPIAVGEGYIDSNYLEVTALDNSTNEVWTPAISDEYDIYLMIDMDGDGDFTEYVDLGYSNSFYYLIVENNGPYVSLDIDDFHKEPLPSDFGVYSDSRVVPFEHTFDNFNIDSVNELYPAPDYYDGNYVMAVDFADSYTSKLVMNFPVEIDVSNSTDLVFSLYTNGIMLENFQVGLFFSDGTGVYVSVYFRDTYYSDEGSWDLGSSGLWDKYTIPLSHFGFTTGDLIRIEIANPQYMPVGDTLLFDDIHFE